MPHLKETQRIEILILIRCGPSGANKTTYIKLKQEEFPHRLAYSQQAGGWQFEHLIP
jgi:hypothetical protein